MKRHFFSLVFLSLWLVVPLVASGHRPRVEPGQPAKVSNGAGNPHRVPEADGSAPANGSLTPAPMIKAPGKSYLAAPAGPNFRAQRIWSEKLREANEKGFQWGPAIAQSAMLLAIAHTYRIADQPDTRANLKGPFFKDWYRSVRGLHGWDDGDSQLANYVAHPMQGAVTGYFQIQNDPRGRLQEFGWSRGYWKSRLKAFGWSLAYSTMYELSPIGDPGIGNVGHPEYNPGTKGFVDLVITPTLGISLLVFEDMLDQKVVWPIEKRTHSKLAKQLLRSFVGMHRSFANLFRFKRPWYMDSRGPVNEPAIRYSQLPAYY